MQNQNCCTPKSKTKAKCPICHQVAKGVLDKTLKSLLTKNAKSKLSSLDEFYYCKNSSCKVVYFKDNIILTQEDMSIVVGLKDGSIPATICYCFKWTKEKIKIELKETGKTKALHDIKTKMKTIGCNCEMLNPSGRCCLGDVSKAIKELTSLIEGTKVS